MKHQNVFCPNCHSSDLRVISTHRQLDGLIIRRRFCLEDDCGHKWYTLQQPETVLDLNAFRHTRGFGYQLLSAT